MAKRNRHDRKASPAAATPGTATVSGSFQHLGIEWRTSVDGSGELVVAYDGPLATRDELIARAGTWRQGKGPWGETREVSLKRQGRRWVGAIAVSPGAPVEGVEFVFRAGDDWDNGGRAPLGYYEWDPRQGRIEVR